MKVIWKKFFTNKFSINLALPKFYWGTREVEVVRERESQYEMTSSDLAWYNALSIAQTAAIAGSFIGLIAGVLTSVIN